MKLQGLGYRTWTGLEAVRRNKRSNKGGCASGQTGDPVYGKQVTVTNYPVAKDRQQGREVLVATDYFRYLIYAVALLAALKGYRLYKKAQASSGSTDSFPWQAYYSAGYTFSGFF